MKTQKVTLQELCVKSFVTSALDGVKAGVSIIDDGGQSNDSNCRTACNIYCEEWEMTLPL